MLHLWQLLKWAEIMNVFSKTIQLKAESLTTLQFLSSSSSSSSAATTSLPLSLSSSLWSSTSTPSLHSRHRQGFHYCGNGNVSDIETIIILSSAAVVATVFVVASLPAYEMQCKPLEKYQNWGKTQELHF